jgi:general secretion pathway protein K
MTTSSGSRRAGRSVRSRGGALLMVLWVSAALAAIGFSLASTVRGEIERTGTAVDDLRSYYLAVGGIQRGMVELLWGALHQERRVIPRGSVVVPYTFPSGLVELQILPEAGKLNVNHAPVLDLVRLLVALGENNGQAQAIAEAIADWRGGSPGPSLDGFYQSQVPSFRAPHASFQEIEELLLVRGVTPDLFYGTYVPAETGTEDGVRLVRRGGLAECLSVYGSNDRVDANTAAPAVLTAVGLSPYAVSALVERRAKAPLTEGELGAFMAGLGAPMQRLRTEGNSIVTFKATARLRLPNGELSDLRRTVGAQAKYFQRGSKFAIDVLRWHDSAWSN